MDNNYIEWNNCKGGNIFLLAPGLINTESCKDLSKRTSIHDAQIIIIPNNSINLSNIDILNILKNQGYQVLIEYTDDLYKDLIQSYIQFVSVFPDKDIINLLGEVLLRNYNDMEFIYNRFFMDSKIESHIVKILKCNTYKILKIANPNFNLRNAINEFIFFNKEYFIYV